MKRLEAIITGRVQGVGYRNFAWKKAKELGLTGYVRNQVDGTVLAVAEGNAATLSDLISQLRRGPLLARVDDIREEYSTATGEFEDYEVRY